MSEGMENSAANKSTGSSSMVGAEGATDRTDVEQLKALVIPAPSSPKVCSLCQESFEELWSDAEEEWLYKNAVSVENKVNFLLVSCLSVIVDSFTMPLVMQMNQNVVVIVVVVVVVVF